MVGAHPLLLFFQARVNHIVNDKEIAVEWRRPGMDIGGFHRGWKGMKDMIRDSSHNVKLSWALSSPRDKQQTCAELTPPHTACVIASCEKDERF